MKSTMMEQPVTPMNYVREMAAMSWRHGSELAAAGACAIVLVVAAFALSGRALLVLPSAMAVVIAFAGGMAAWRLHRRQHIALATVRSLLDLNAADRAELESLLRNGYRRREARIHARNEVRLERLGDEMTVLRTELLERSHRRIAT